MDRNIADVAVNSTPIVAYFDQSVTLHAPLLATGQLSALNAVLFIAFATFAAGSVLPALMAPLLVGVTQHFSTVALELQSVLKL